MSWEKIKEIAKISIKEGSINILAITIGTLIVLANIKDAIIIQVITIMYAASLIITFGIILLRIVVNQYCMVKLRLDKLGTELKLNDYTELDKDTFSEQLIPVAMDLIKKAKEKLLKKN